MSASDDGPTPASDPAPDSRGFDGVAGDTLLLRLRKHRRAASPFEERGELGKGGMGRVLESVDKDLRRTVAVKVLREVANDPELNEDLRERFLQEAQITAQLDHPGVPPIHELGVTSDGQVYYVMPRLRGGTLEEVFKRCWKGDEDWTLERCLATVQRVCETLAFAHSRGVIHRDIKPANIMVGEYGEVLVIDWGLARLVRSNDAGDRVWTDRLEALMQEADALLITSPKGTPGFMAPEQVSFEATRQDERVDVYAVGAMLYLLLGKRIPHASSLAELGRQRLNVDRLREILAERPTPLQELDPGVPAELVAICQKAMSPDRRDRYASAAELADDLRAFLEVRPVHAYRTGAWAEFSKWIRRNRTVAGLSGMLLLGGLGASVGGFALERDRVEALEASRDRERNLTGALRLDSVLSRSQMLFVAPSQLDDARAVQRDGAALQAQEDDLTRRHAELSQLRAQALEPQEDLELQVAELERQIQRMPDLEAALERALLIEQRIERESHFRPDTSRVRERWDQALAALAVYPDFAGVDITPRDDLLPLGPTEPAGLWAFLVLETADFSTPLEYDHADEVGPERGIVLLLLPGGVVRLGSREVTTESEIAQPFFDIYFDRDESSLGDAGGSVPVEVHLAPYYLGRFEVTRAQWERVMGDSRGWCPVPAETDAGLLPVESLSRFEAQTFTARLGLTLPTEAQWEAACRARTTSPTFVELPFTLLGPGSGDYDWRELSPYANVLDRTALNENLSGANRELFAYPLGEPDDGFIYTSPVGTFAPNPFGLFDMCGNVWEWCRDDYVDGWGQLAKGDGLQVGKAQPNGGILRGGSWMTPADQCRASNRFDAQPGLREYDTGFRVALPAQ